MITQYYIIDNNFLGTLVHPTSHEPILGQKQNRWTAKNCIL